MLSDFIAPLKRIRFDVIIIIMIIPLIYVSHHLIAEISVSLANKQTVYGFLGVMAFVFFTLLPIRKLLWVVPAMYWVSIGLLILVEFVGTSKLGAQRWIEIPLINFTLQPSELIKPAFLLMLAYLISENPPEEKGYNLKQFLHLSFYIMLPTILILMQPDLGTASILAFVGFVTVFLVGIRWKITATILLGVAVFLPVFYLNFMHDYQKKRIHDFLAAKPSYHVQQSLIAIGNGGLLGQPQEKATQGGLNFLPIATSDFIFAYHIERYGFLGGLGLVVLYLLLIVHVFLISQLEKKDHLLKVFAFGVSVLVFLYVVINIAMVVGFFPVVGVPLPLFSYGGSSFITFMALFGMLENLIAFRFVYMYDILYKS